MKKLLLILLKIFTVVLVQAQVPGEINYQGVARNPGGVALANQNISLRISIRNNSTSGTIIYQETRKITTNNFGLFTVAIGGAGAMSTTGTIKSVDWSNGTPKYVQVEIDPNAGNSFKNMGTAQLLSVPFALHAESTSRADIALYAQSASRADSALYAQSSTRADSASYSQSASFAQSAKRADTASITDTAFYAAEIADGAVTTNKIQDGAVTTAKIQDAAITADKLAPGVIVSGSQPTGSAGGDLNGSYPNPSIAPQSITSNKIANGAVTTNKINDGAVTAAKLANNVIPTSLPPSGSAGGDLSGNYPNPSVVKLQGFSVNNSTPTTGQVLKYDGTKWTPSTDIIGTFTLPYSSTNNSAGSLFAVTNQGNGISLEGINSANGTGVYGTTVNGSGVSGRSNGGNGVQGVSTDGVGVFGTSDNGLPGLFNITNSNNFNDAVLATNSGFGNGIVALSTYSNGVLGIANDLAGAGIFGINNAGGEGVVGRGFSDFAAGVVGRNDGAYAGVKAVSAAMNGTALLAQANVDGFSGGTAITAELEGTNPGNLAVFKANGVNVARIDHTGKAFFNNSTQVGGADVAEYFAVEGNRSSYEPGDVLVISQSTDRTVEKSTTPYSNLVSGVYATKAGLLLTEENAEQDDLASLVPMGVIGVIPVKVSNEGGAIKRGDMLVTSSTPGVAMKADPDKVKTGQVIGKALQDYNGSGVAKINVLVSVK